MKVKIEKLIYGGFGLGRQDDGKPLFVRKAVPGDLLEVEITKNKKSYAEGRILSIIEPSISRIAPRCPHFDRCGGCEHQNISYSDQLRFKADIFKETLERAGIQTEILPIIAGSKSEYYYRNTMRFFFDVDQSGQIGFAMHDFADFNRLIPVDSCFLQSETSNKILSELKKLLNSQDESEVKDWLQHKKILDSLWQIRIRESKSDHEIMVEIITKTNHLPLKQEIINLLKTFPEIKSAYHAIAHNESIAWQRRLLFGSPIIYEKVGKFTFQISPDSFFQTNSLGIKTLYDKIKEFAEIKIGESVLDLYCGTGTIGLYLSTLAGKVTGIESVQSAVNDAKANARINKVPNTEFICTPVEKWLKSSRQASNNNYSSSQPDRQAGASEKFTKVIVDPPRDGLTHELIHRLDELSNFTNLPRRQAGFQLIYVSCNPSTFARDIKEFEKTGLKLKKVQPVDMFPQTHHIECVGLLAK